MVHMTHATSCQTSGRAKALEVPPRLAGLHLLVNLLSPRGALVLLPLIVHVALALFDIGRRMHLVTLLAAAAIHAPRSF